MKYFATLGAVCALGLSALAGQAQADIYIFTHSGTVASGIDIYGLFGGQNANLTGSNYAVSFMFDADSLIHDPVSGPGFIANGYFADNGLVKITINGKDHYIGPTSVSYSLVAAEPPYVGSKFYALSATVLTPGEAMLFQLVSDTQFAGSNELSGPFQYSPTDADLANPFSTGSYWDAVDFKVVFNTKEISLTSQAGDLPSIPTAAVPEPASWALMIGGFGGAGAMLRSRRRPAFVG